MAGYHNFSMSNNAVAAYEDGEKPLSKWTKAAILAAVAEIAPEKVDMLKGAPLAALRANILRKSSWHHTSSHYNETDFFSIDEYELDELTPETVATWTAEAKEDKVKKDAPARRAGSIAYIEWAGSRNHPRAIKRFLDGVEIEEKGAFFIVYKDGSQVLRKKIGSTGTVVEYKNDAQKLPELTGTQKQVAWAKEIRGRMFSMIEQAAKIENVDRATAYEALSAKTEARWWIDREIYTVKRFNVQDKYVPASFVLNDALLDMNRQAAK